MTIVKNSWGKDIDYDAAVMLMDDEIREEVHAELAPCSDQGFFDAYCKRHLQKNGEAFVCDTENPCY